jgi:hypothetical protein
MIVERYVKPNGVGGGSIPDCEIFFELVDGKTTSHVAACALLCSEREFKKKIMAWEGWTHGAYANSSIMDGKARVTTSVPYKVEGRFLPTRLCWIRHE